MRNRQGDEFKIRISGLSSGLHEYHFSSTPSELGLESNFTKPVEVDVSIDKTPRHVYLTSEIRTSGLFNCDRCIEDFERPVTAQYMMLYVFDDREKGSFSEDQVQVISPDTVCIDVTADIRQMIFLSVPLKLLCNEECKGLCPQCGKNRNVETCDCRDGQVDSRWQGLAGLKTN